VTRIPVLGPNGKHIGYVRAHPIPDLKVTRWLSWRLHDPHDRAIGSHQDQAQAERYLRWLDRPTSPQVP
jgi:hypothetical protein